MQATPSPTASPPPFEKLESAVLDQPTYPLPPANVKSIPFSVLVGLYERLLAEKKPDKRRKLLAGWINHWREEVGYDFYPVLRLLLPQKDRERAVYGLKEKNLAKVYIKLIPLGTKDPDAVRLLNWKKPTERDKSSGDFSTVLYEVISKRSSVMEGTLSIDDVNRILDDLCKDMGKQEVQSKLLHHVYNNCTPEEQRWIARIIMKDMNISVKENTVFAVVHPDAHDLFNTCSDLKKVAYELWDPARRLNEEDKSVQLFRAFAPMLCKRPTGKIEDTIKEMEGSVFTMEEKLDGERMQLHKRGNEYFYCSRKGKDYTYLYGKHVGVGSLTPYIDRAFDGRVEEVILDGEMLVWDPVSERNLPFGSLKTAALDNSKSKVNPRPCFKIFDLLYLNGHSLARKSLKFRKRNLKAYVKEVKGRMEYISEREGRTAADARNFMDEIMANRGEGIILKHPDSEYVLNGRNKDWFKVKPEYMDNMGETVDVLVIGGVYGSGKRSGGVSALICGVLDDRAANFEDSEPKYCTFVRTGTGLTYADYVWIRQKPWKPFDKNNMPPWYLVSRRGTEDKPDAYLDPEDSFILKVKAAEITPTDQYHLGFTMRFPRTVMIRDDLTIADCMTASAVLESIRSEKKRKMEDKDTVTSKKRKTIAKKITVMPEYQGPSLKGLQVESDLFQDLTFMVASDPRAREGDKEKRELMRLIHVNGGKCVQIAGSSPVLVVYGGKTTPYDLKLIIDKDIHDIIKPQWIRDCIAQGERVPLRRKYFFHATTDRSYDKEYNHPDNSDAGRAPEETPSGSELGSSRAESPPELDEAEAAADTGVNVAMADWFRVDERDATAKRAAKADVESETDPDSDYEEARAEDDGADEWTDVTLPEGTLDDASDITMDDDIKMGEDAEAMEYDTERIFRHLCFYLDTPDNASKNGMAAKSKHAERIAASFTDVEDVVVANGGRIVDLDDPKLTHIVVDKRDISRWKELTKRTSTPKRRNIVISDFIHACVDEGTLLNEEAFAP